jgi:polyphosphate glucokinase
MSTEAANRFAIGIDIGGTGIKAALVDTTTGRLPFKRLRVLTPKPGTPTAVAETIAVLLEDLTQQALDLELVTDRAELDSLPVGCGFPGVIRRGRVEYTANLDQSWIGSHIDAVIGDRTGRTVYFLNDADGAGLAEMIFGAGRSAPEEDRAADHPGHRASAPRCSPRGGWCRIRSWATSR